MGPLILLAAFAALGVATLTGVYAAFRHRYFLARTATAGAASVITAYAGAMAYLNPTLTQRAPIALGEPHHFCGFYLDCHLSATVLGVERVPSLGAPPFVAESRDLFHVIRVRLSNDARRATLRLSAPEVWVEDVRGNRYFPSPLADTIAHATGTVAPSLDTPLGAGSSLTTTLTFDLPAHGTPFRLRIVEGGIADRFTERVLIGDEDAFFARASGFALE